MSMMTGNLEQVGIIKLDTKNFNEARMYVGRSNGETVIAFRDNRGVPLAKATVAVPKADLDGDEVAIKNYSENEGMLECLVDAEVVGEPKRYVETGQVEVPICDLLVDTNGGDSNAK